MYWGLGKFLALIPVIILILSPFVGKIRRRFMSWEIFEYTMYYDLFESIEDKEIDTLGAAFVFLLGIIGILIISFVLYWVVVLIYPVLILAIVVMWLLKKTYSNKKSKI